ncbi:P-loop containing nucleoside triphosphate hydrolase protein [Powellomyces hirtus]|nr:P-loop containing nucleoside triphosphate hydrolase protein [Powellomyces hirtus]
MSSVQEAVLSLLPIEKDLLVRAKTGTGKTLAFIIAALESAIARRKGQRFNAQHTTILVLSPTRELALQIAAEAQRLMRPHNYRVQTAVGGPGRNRSVAGIVRDRTDVLVATPGRLLDMLENEPDFRRKIQGLQTLIFDEADQLLEMGFKDAIDAIVAKLPAQRQTFMFSATLSRDIKSIAARTLQSGYEYVDTVPVNETPTHMKVKQSYTIVPFSQQLVLLHEMIYQHRRANPAGKIIVFFPTTKIVAYLAGVFNDIPGMDVLEIHSKLSQVQRARVAQRFRRAHGGVLFTSDVSARGVDYPGVTLVIQMGMPSSREQYIHRVGRTGRAGATGEGIIMLSPYEQKFVDALHEIPIKRDLRYGSDSDVHKKDKVKDLINNAMRHAPQDMAQECYGAYLGFRESMHHRINALNPMSDSSSRLFRQAKFWLAEKQPRRSRPWRQ